MTIRALVVDDSVIFRKLVRDSLGRIPNVQVIDFAKDGHSAVEKIDKLRPDFVTLDVEMPGLNGLEVLRELQRRKIQTRVVMISSLTKRGAVTTTQALQLGAFDFVLKPDCKTFEENQEELFAQLKSRVQTIATPPSSSPTRDGLSARVGNGSQVAKHTQTSSPNSVNGVSGSRVTPDSPMAERPQHSASIASRPNTRSPNTTRPMVLDAICIGISTGGPKALATLLPELPENFSVPILIVQHMPAIFTKSMAENLNQQCRLNICEASDGDRISRGSVYIAPGGKQMAVRGFPGAWTVEVTDDPPLRNCKPSVDYLFDSAAKQFGRRMLGIVMTGMGDDGLIGCQKIAASGGTVWSQSASTCTVYGMPKRVEEAGLSNEVIPLHQLADRIVSVSGSRSLPPLPKTNLETQIQTFS